MSLEPQEGGGLSCLAAPKTYVLPDTFCLII